MCAHGELWRGHCTADAYAILQLVLSSATLKSGLASLQSLAADKSTELVAGWKHAHRCDQAEYPLEYSDKAGHTDSHAAAASTPEAVNTALLLGSQVPSRCLAVARVCKDGVVILLLTFHSKDCHGPACGTKPRPWRACPGSRSPNQGRAMLLQSAAVCRGADVMAVLRPLERLVPAAAGALFRQLAVTCRKPAVQLGSTCATAGSVTESRTTL